MPKKIILSLLLMVTVAFSQFTVKLAWDPVTTPDLSGYRIYYGTASDTYSTILNVGKVLEKSIPFTTPAHYYFVATAYDSIGNESAYSNQVDTILVSLAITYLTYADASIACAWTPSAPAYALTCVIGAHSETLTTFENGATIILPDQPIWTTAAITVQALNLQNEIIATAASTIAVPNSCDFDNDGKVYLSDFTAFANSFYCLSGNSCYKRAFDTNRDGIIYSYDFKIFAERYGLQKNSAVRLGALSTTFEQLKGTK